MVGVGTIEIGALGSEIQYNYTSLSFIQTHPKEGPDMWEAEIDASYNAVNYGDSVLIKRDGAIIFTGFVDTKEPRFSSKSGRMLYVSGPCWKGALELRIVDQKMVGTGSDDLDKSFFAKCYSEDILRFMIQTPQSDPPRIDPEVREGEGLYKDTWTVRVVTVLNLKATGYTDCVITDIGKEVEDDGVGTGHKLLGFDNTYRRWYIEGNASSIAANSAMTINGGTGAGTAESDATYAGGSASIDNVYDRDNTRIWRSNGSQKKDFCIIIDLGFLGLNLCGIRIECRGDEVTNKPNEFMRNYTIEIAQNMWGPWIVVAQKANNTARDVVHGWDPTDKGKSKRYIRIALTNDYNVPSWAISEIYVYHSYGVPLSNRIPIVEVDVDECGNPLTPVNIDNYMSIASIFQLITDITLTTKEGVAPSKVMLYLKMKKSGSGHVVYVTAYLWDGTAYQSVAVWNTTEHINTNWNYYGKVVTSTLDTIDKINNTKLKLAITGAGLEGGHYIHCTYAYLKVTIDGINYILPVTCRAAETQTWETTGDEPWLEFNDNNATQIKEDKVDGASQGYIFEKLTGGTGGGIGRPWEYWIEGAKIRLLTFGATYTDCVDSDIGKTVTGADTNDTGTLVKYNNTSKKWWVLMDANDDLFDISETVSVSGGTGTGTTTGPSVAGKVWNFKTRRGSDLSGSVEFKYDSTHSASSFINIEKRESVQGIINRLKVIAGGEGIEQEVACSDWLVDMDSIKNYGLHEGTHDESRIDDKKTANAFGKSLLSEYSNPRSTVRVEIYDEEVSNTWGVGDEVTLTDTHTGLSGKYRIMSVKREYDADGETVTIIASDSSSYLPKFKPEEEIEWTEPTSLPRKGGGD